MSILLITRLSTNSTHPPFDLRRRTLVLILAFSLMIGGVYAQDEPEIDPMQADETRVVTLDGISPTQLVYEALAGDVITITARSLEADAEQPAVRDMVLDVLAEDGTQLAYNDDHNSQRDDLAAVDAMIERLLLPEAGTYTIRVNTYGGIFEGAVEVTLTASDLYEAEFNEGDDGTLTVSARLPRDGRYAYTFEVGEGEILTLSAQDTSFTLDPRLTLLDADGTIIAQNDDHGSDDLTLDLLDAKIADFPVTSAGRYTVVVTDFIGRSGMFDLSIERR